MMARKKKRVSAKKNAPSRVLSPVEKGNDYEKIDTRWLLNVESELNPFVFQRTWVSSR